jgi:hypothetical protein
MASINTDENTSPLPNKETGQVLGHRTALRLSPRGKKHKVNDHVQRSPLTLEEQAGKST